MKQTICDICKKDCVDNKHFSFKMLDGEHPHNGSTMFSTVDVCYDCLNRFNNKQGPIPVRI